jgi:haloalkane dehalogenase
MHYVEVGEGPPVLFLHGQPTWGYLYREFIALLVAAGYRCVLPDYIGFGKSDKVLDDEWYVIERHCESVRSFVEALDLSDVTIVVHDWGGPIGLRQVVDMPERFSRLVVLNTWLHHVDMEYTDAIRHYRDRIVHPEEDPWPNFPASAVSRAEWALAPFPDDTYRAGMRRFPYCHPYAKPIEGNALEQARCFEALKRWSKPAHLIWGEQDPIFPPRWGQQWASLLPRATFDVVPGGHFLQVQSAQRIVDLMLGYMGLSG